jgi:hypothetical protein
VRIFQERDHVVAVHNNFILGHAAKKQRFMEFGLWIQQHAAPYSAADSIKQAVAIQHDEMPRRPEGCLEGTSVSGETRPRRFIRHPEDEPISIYLQIEYKLDGDPTFVMEEPAELPLSLKGTVTGSQYSLQWAVYDSLHAPPLHKDELHFDTVNVSGRATNVFAGTTTEFTSFQIPAGSVDLEGVTLLQIVVRDRYPGLSEDDAFLALTRRKVVWWHGGCACAVLWDSASEDKASSRDDAPAPCLAAQKLNLKWEEGNVTLATAASIDRLAQLMTVGALWDG